MQRLNVLRDEAEAARDALREEKARVAMRVAVRTEELAQTNRALAAEISDRTRVETQPRELLQRLAADGIGCDPNEDGVGARRERRHKLAAKPQV